MEHIYENDPSAESTEYLPMRPIPSFSCQAEYYGYDPVTYADLNFSCDSSLSSPVSVRRLPNNGERCEYASIDHDRTRALYQTTIREYFMEDEEGIYESLDSIPQQNTNIAEVKRNERPSIWRRLLAFCCGCCMKGQM